VQDLPSEEDWERADLGEDEQILVEQLAALIELNSLSQYRLFDFFESVEPAIRGAVYAAAIEKVGSKVEGQTHGAPRSVQ
jgi:hypothetical protein